MSFFRRSIPLALLAFVAAWSSGCDSEGSDGPIIGRTVIAPLSSPDDTTTGVSGTVRLTERNSELRMVYDLSGLSPGKHGLHVHENASCARGDFDRDGRPEAAGAAGRHYDPLNTGNHSGPSTSEPETRHLGDLGNITANESGDANGSRAIRGLQLSGTLDGTEYSMISGRSIVIYSGRDDLESEPDGNPGERVGCGALTLQE